MKTLKSNLFVHVHGLQKVAVATLTLIIFLNMVNNVKSQTVLLDSTFGQNGTVTVPEMFNVNHIYCYNNHIFAVGIETNSFNEVIVKTDANGTIDTDFGNNGFVRYSDYLTAPVELHYYRVFDIRFVKEKILVFVQYIINGFQEQPVATIVMMFNSDGTFDMNFGNSGQIMIQSEFIDAVDIDNDIEYITISEFTSDGSYPYSRISKYDCHKGTIDTGFGTNGTVHLSNTNIKLVAKNIKILNDGSILVAGFNYNPLEPYSIAYQLAFCKLTPNGDFVANFANNGIFVSNFETDSLHHNPYFTFNNVIEDNIGNLIFVGALPNEDLFVSRFNSNGIIDSNFGVNGFFIYGNYMNRTDYNTFIQNANKYLLASANEIISIKNDGTLDQDFNNTGFYTFDDFAIYCMNLQTPNKLVVGGFYAFSLARLDLGLLMKSSNEPMSFSDNHKNTFALYPNPVKDNLNFTEEMQVEITDIQGRTLLKTTKAVKTFDVSSLQAGVYFLKTNNKVEKFVKE